MDVCIVSHTENFKDNEEKFRWIVKELENVEKDLGKKIKINWMLEEDDTSPYRNEIHGSNRGDLITNGKEFFQKLHRKGHELGLHLHFTRSWKVDFSYDNSRRLLRSAKSKFIDAFGFEPKSFCGGWWHSDERTLRALEEEGFLIDASPCPLYKEKRRRWLFGRIPLPFTIETCDWSGFTKRTPFFPSAKNKNIEGDSKILYIPNAVDPSLTYFNPNGMLSIEMIDENFESQLKVFKSFADSGIELVSMHFHPHSLNARKMSFMKDFFRRCDKVSKIRFVTLSEVYNKYGK
jgi:hypothetical protein